MHQSTVLTTPDGVAPSPEGSSAPCVALGYSHCALALHAGSMRVRHIIGGVQCRAAQTSTFTVNIFTNMHE